MCPFHATERRADGNTGTILTRRENARERSRGSLRRRCRNCFKSFARDVWTLTRDDFRTESETPRTGNTSLDLAEKTKADRTAERFIKTSESPFSFPGLLYFHSDEKLRRWGAASTIQERRSYEREKENGLLPGYGVEVPSRSTRG